MRPPWDVFPSIPLGSIGWRMGDGEEYWVKFSRWYDQLQPVRREQYEREHPEPGGWAGFYARKNDYLRTRSVSH